MLKFDRDDRLFCCSKKRSHCHMIQKFIYFIVYTSCNFWFSEYHFRFQMKHTLSLRRHRFYELVWKASIHKIHFQISLIEVCISPNIMQNTQMLFCTNREVLGREKCEISYCQFTYLNLIVNQRSQIKWNQVYNIMVNDTKIKILKFEGSNNINGTNFSAPDLVKSTKSYKSAFSF